MNVTIVAIEATADTIPLIEPKTEPSKPKVLVLYSS